MVRHRWLAQPRGRYSSMVIPVHRYMCRMKHPIGEVSGSRQSLAGSSRQESSSA